LPRSALGLNMLVTAYSSPIAISLMKMVGPKAPTAVHRPLGMTYHSKEKASVIPYCLENQFTSHDLCGKTISVE
jgi:hypothetical protein